MISYNEFFANISRIEKSINDTANRGAIINLRGLQFHQSLRQLAGQYFLALAGYSAAVLRGGDGPTVGYDNLREAVGVLIYAKSILYMLDGNRVFSIGVLAPGDVDDVIESVTAAELDDYAHMNPIQFIGRNAIVPEALADRHSYSPQLFHSWLDEQLYALACYCLTHNIDLDYIIRQTRN